jgi:hypothetical protein
MGDEEEAALAVADSGIFALKPGTVVSIRLVLPGAGAWGVMERILDHGDRDLPRIRRPVRGRPTHQFYAWSATGGHAEKVSLHKRLRLVIAVIAGLSAKSVDGASATRPSTAAGSAEAGHSLTAPMPAP